MFTFVPRDKVSKNWVILGPLVSIISYYFFWFIDFHLSWI